jgi:hypothetical protein
MNTSLEEMEMEIKFHTDIKNKKDTIELGKSFLFNAVNAIEFLNDRYDPFGFKLSGWGEQMKLSGNDYNDVFGELADKYKSSGKKMEPELRLIMMIGASAASFHISKSLSNVPAIGDVIKNNPELLRKIQSNITKNISNAPPTEGKQTEDLYKKMQENKLMQERLNKQQQENELLQQQLLNQQREQQIQNQLLQQKILQQNQLNQLNQQNQQNQEIRKSMLNQEEMKKNNMNMTLINNIPQTSSIKNEIKQPTNVNNILNKLKPQMPVTETIDKTSSISIHESIDSESVTNKNIITKRRLNNNKTIIQAKN